MNRPSKLNLDWKLVDECRDSARAIGSDMDAFIRDRTTVAVERTVARLFGIDGVTPDGEVPLPNVVVDQLDDAGTLGRGVAWYVANGIVQTGKSPQELAEACGAGELNLTSIAEADRSRVLEVGDELGRDAVARVAAAATERTRRMETAETPDDPLLYVIVATGNIYEDAVQGRTAATQGADVVAVIRSTGQSLLDFVPYGATTEGFGGTFATQANFRIMREALDEVASETGRYHMLCNYCSGLCMPEIAAMGALERLDMMLNDALYGILFRDINPQRTLIDQYFSRMINALAGVIINTGEDNYLTTDDAVEATHTVLASQFINEQFAANSGLRPAQMGLGHAMEMNPTLKNGFLMELAQAQLVREVFPDHRLKYMPPTKYMTGDTFKGIIQDALFNLIGAWTNQGVQLLGMHTEAMHTPHMADRALAIENARYVMNNARDIGDEIEFKQGGLLQRRAQETLVKTVDLLSDVESRGLFDSLATGTFAAVRRRPDGGKGLAGVVDRDSDYYNPVERGLRSALGLEVG